MTHGNRNSEREERLAAKLRENLRRRKAQARAVEGAGGGTSRNAQASKDSDAGDDREAGTGTNRASRSSQDRTE